MAGQHPKYEGWSVVREIGSGSFGKVYEIQREDFGYTYKAALKVISIPQSQNEIDTARMSEDLTDEKSLQQYFYSAASEIVKEFELMFKLKGNTHIVSYEDHKVIPHSDGVGWDIFIRMELLTPLSTWFETHKLTRHDIINMGIDLCDALERCQKFNIIHRDIKPANIFVSDQGDFKLGDFGIARTMEKHSFMDMSRKGTVNYMAPEVAVMGNYGFSVDLYSLGLVMYGMLNNNRMPFAPRFPKQQSARDKENAIGRRFKGEPMPYPANDHSQLSDIILKACAYRPEDRYSSPGAMKADLEALLVSGEEWDNVVGRSDTLPRGPGGISDGSITRGHVFYSDSGSDVTLPGELPDLNRNGVMPGTLTAGKPQTNSNWAMYAAVAAVIILTLIIGVLAAMNAGKKSQVSEIKDAVIEAIDEYDSTQADSPSAPEPTLDPAHTIEESDAGTTIETWNEIIAGEFRPVKKQETSADGTVLLYLYKYDAEGKQILEEQYRADGTMAFSSELGDAGYTIEKTFNSAGCILSEKQFHADGSSGLSWAYEYDDAGNMVLETNYRANGEVIYTISNAYKEGLLIVSTKQYSDGMPAEVSSYSYDDYQLKTELVVEDGKGAVLETHRFNYKDDGTCQESIDYADGTCSVVYYDRDGHEAQGEEYDANGGLILTYENRYDFRNRLTNQTKYNEDGSPAGHTEYEYDTEGYVSIIRYYNGDGSLAIYVKNETGRDGSLTITFYNADDTINQIVYCNEEGEVLDVITYNNSEPESNDAADSAPNAAGKLFSASSASDE